MKILQAACKSNGEESVTVNEVYAVANYLLKYGRLTDSQKQGLGELARALEGSRMYLKAIANFEPDYKV